MRIRKLQLYNLIRDKNLQPQNSNPVFDYRALRLLVGLIAFALPITVSIVSKIQLSSISASYHTNARDIFVGMLFIVGSFLWAYNGHSKKESIASKAASIAAVLVALFPTSCDTCDSDYRSTIHYIAAASLFLLLAYFCFGPFRIKIKSKKGKKGRRSKIYFTCGSVMVACMVILAIAKLTLSKETINAFSVTYWAEAIALGAFGVAWMVAGKYFKLFVDSDEALRLFQSKS